MKILVLQPQYPAEGTPSAAQSCLSWMTAQLEKLEPGCCDLIALPECANVPGIGDKSLLREFANSHGSDFINRISACSKRLKSMIAVGVIVPDGSRWVNRAVLFDANGEAVHCHDKAHLTSVEIKDLELSPGSDLRIFESSGVRIGFAICFDLYFPEYFAALAAQKPDIIICPSYQRSESAERIRFISQARAFDSGAFIIRSSFSMGKATAGGNSLIASPSGEILANAGAEPAVIHFDIDPHEGFVKPASHGQPDVIHRELIESHRRPELYRPLADRSLEVENASFPRICAHRGASHACPENTLPAFAAAIAAGAHEIEFDLWMSADGVPVVCHDEDLSRTTDGAGRIGQLEWSNIRLLDAGIKHGERWKNVPVPRLEDVLRLIDNRVGLNIHIKNAGPDGQLVKTVCNVLREHALTNIAYIAGCTHPVLKHALEYAPDIPRACLISQDNPNEQLRAAKEYRCKSTQFGRTVSPEDTRRAHECGIICGLFWSDDPDEAREYIRNGIDVILTNRPHHLIASGLF